MISKVRISNKQRKAEQRTEYHRQFPRSDRSRPHQKGYKLGFNLKGTK